MLAGCSVYGRPLTLQEAWDAAVGVCNIGLEIPSRSQRGAADRDDARLPDRRADRPAPRTAERVSGTQPTRDPTHCSSAVAVLRRNPSALLSLKAGRRSVGSHYGVLSRPMRASQRHLRPERVHNTRRAPYARESAFKNAPLRCRRRVRRGPPVGVRKASYRRSHTAAGQRGGTGIRPDLRQMPWPLEPDRGLDNTQRQSAG